MKNLKPCTLLLFCLSLSLVSFSFAGIQPNERIAAVEKALASAKLELLMLKEANLKQLEILLAHRLGDYEKLSDEEVEKEKTHLKTLSVMLADRKKSLSAELVHAELRKEVVFDIEFSGGSARDLADELLEVVGADANIVVLSEDGEDVNTVPAFSLKGVSLDSVFEMLSRHSSRTGQMSGWSNVEGIWFYTGSSIGSEIFRSYKLSELLEVYAVESITTAIQAALEMRGFEESTMIKYHPDTQLLLVVGYPESVSVVEYVISELEL